MPMRKKSYFVKWVMITELILFFVQASESKKEVFRKYLEASGVLDALTKGFILT